MCPQLNQAMVFAKAAHSGQHRKYTNEPYICHPLAVAGIVFSVTDSEVMLSAAVLHDVVEDTIITTMDIAVMISPKVAYLVDELTDVSKPSDGNRAKRKGIDLQHTKEASPDAKTIKLADLIDNTKTIVGFDPDFARVYMHEKKRLLEVLTEGNAELYWIAEGLVERYYKTRRV